MRHSVHRVKIMVEKVSRISTIKRVSYQTYVNKSQYLIRDQHQNLDLNIFENSWKFFITAADCILQNDIRVYH